MLHVSTVALGLAATAMIPTQCAAGPRVGAALSMLLLCCGVGSCYCWWWLGFGRAAAVLRESVGLHGCLQRALQPAGAEATC